MAGTGRKETDGTEWRGMEGRGRVAVSEGSRRQMREMVAVMGERESGEEGMFTAGNEYDILGEEEQGERWEDRKKATAKAPSPQSIASVALVFVFFRRTS